MQINLSVKNFITKYKKDLSSLWRCKIFDVVEKNQLLIQSFYIKTISKKVASLNRIKLHGER